MFRARRKATPSNEAAGAPALPVFDGGRCVHDRSVVSTCKACVEACPNDALVMDDELLGLDEDACSGCGLCQPACLQNAITFEPAPPGKADRILLACERSGRQYTGLQISCIHQTGMEQLAKFYNTGVRTLLIATPDCDLCENGGGIRLEDYLAAFNELAASRALEPLEAVSAGKDTPGKWRDRDNRLENPGRRNLFAALTGRERRTGHKSRPDSGISHLAQFQKTGAENNNTLFFRIPEIDAKTCDGCDACLNICPSDALTLVNEKSALLCYQVSPENCNGCGLCVDICPPGALSLKALDTCTTHAIALRTFTCASCGASCHEPGIKDDGTSVCRICAQTQNHKKLFQVLT